MAPDGEVAIRPFGDSDSVEALTEMIHRAYAKLGAMGFQYVAADQTPEVTADRIRRAECYVATTGRQVIGTIALYQAGTSTVTPWYARPDVARFGQFAVEPEFQKLGIGSRLLSMVEERAADKGANELALDTAEGAEHLIEFYRRRGYRFIEFARWDTTNYRSVIMSKTLRS